MGPEIANRWYVRSQPGFRVLPKSASSFGLKFLLRARDRPNSQ